jgi:hypothetical protein
MGQSTYRTAEYRHASPALCEAFARSLQGWGASSEMAVSGAVAACVSLRAICCRYLGILVSLIDKRFTHRVDTLSVRPYRYIRGVIPGKCFLYIYSIWKHSLAYHSVLTRQEHVGR